MELDPRLVAKLAQYDDQLRAGIETATIPRDLDPEVAALCADLQECLAALEACWPRTASRNSGLSGGGFPADWSPAPQRIGRFEILSLLGGGGFSLVYSAFDPPLNRKVAIKVPRPHMLLDEELGKRFAREARAIGALDHPNIVPVFESGSIGPAVYLAMAYCEGPSLDAWLREQAEPVDTRVAAQIVACLADAIRYSHQRGVLHRDLKPANVLLFPVMPHEREQISGLPYVPKVADFGLAKLLEGALEDTRSSVVLGTPLYMAPEQISGNPRDIGPWTDLYGLGAILHEMLTGRPPFAGDNVMEVLQHLRESEPAAISKLRSGVPRDLQTICAKCLQKDPADRYASAEDLRQDLEHFLHDRPIVARPLGMFSKAVRMGRKPARVRDAGMYTVIVNLLLIAWILIAFTAAWFQLGRTNSGTDILAGHAVGVVSWLVFGLPPMYFGWMILQRRAWAALAGAIAGTLATIYTMPFVLGFVPFSYGGQYKDPNSRILVFSLLSVMFLCQAILCWFAYRILRKMQ